MDFFRRSTLLPNTHYIIQIISQEIPSQNNNKNAWELLEEMAGTYEAQEDWSSEHDHYLYGTPLSTGQKM